MKVVKENKVILFIVTMLFLLSFSSQNTKDIVIWSENSKLTWDDFEAVAKDTAIRKNLPVAAISVVSIRYGFDYDKKGKLVITVEAYFNKKKSWTTKTIGTLSHEQGHFDIAEIYARKFRKTMRKTRFFSKRIGAEAIKIHDNIMNDYLSYQHIYDSLTNHNNNVAKQKEWEAKIEKELKDLEKYEENKFRIKIW